MATQRACLSRLREFLVASAFLFMAATPSTAVADEGLRRAGTVSIPSRPMWDLLRVRTIGYRLASANATRCVEPTMQTGLILHDLAGFNSADRAQAARDHDLTYGFGVLDLVAGSPAERAGLRRRDEIVTVNGSDLAGFAQQAMARRATYDRVEAFEDLLQGELRKGDARLVVRRGSRILAIDLAAEPGCGGRFAVLASGALNAWSNGKYVTVSTTMLRFVADDGELAFVMAHEMAHNILGHNGRTRAVAGMLAAASARTGGSKTRELAADTFGVRMLETAGFDVHSAARLLDRTAGRSTQGLALSHPGIKRRIAAVSQETVRIAMDRAQPRLAAAAQRGAEPAGLKETRLIEPLTLALGRRPVAEHPSFETAAEFARTAESYPASSLTDLDTLTSRARLAVRGTEVPNYRSVVPPSHRLSSL